jgi:hypothetical protein
MIVIRDIKIEDTSISIKFAINSRLRKKGCDLLATIIISIISDVFSRELSLDSSWIQDTTKELEQSNIKPVKYFILSYQFKKKATIELFAIF